MVAASKVASAFLLSQTLLPVTAVERLTVINQCQRAPIWIAHLANVGVGPGQQNVKISPGESFVFHDPDTDGLSGSRYWPKMGCDDDGDNCAMGGSGGPSQKCSDITPDYSSCAPPIDTKFEATWGRGNEPCDPKDPGTMIGCDFIDVSLVDGWTLPFKLEVTSGTCMTTKDEVIDHIDCSTMSVDNCPKDDNLGHGSVDMTAISPHTKQAVGCYGPCLKLIDNKWGNVVGDGYDREHDDVAPYCCTTPPLDSESCNAGPIVGTKYVNAVHQYCPGVYSFAYDDGMGLLRCEYGSYKLTFYCPEGVNGVPPPEPVVQEPVTVAQGAAPQAGPAGATNAQPAAGAMPARPELAVAPSTDPQSCHFLGCGSHGKGNCACTDECQTYNDCCEDYTQVCKNAPPTLQRDEVITDATASEASAPVASPAVLTAAGLSLFAAASAAVMVVVRGKRSESARMGSVAPME